METATNSSTRKRIYIYNENRCLDNAPLQKEIFILRDEAARLLGYPSHAAFKLESTLAQTPKTVHQLLGEFENLGKSSAESENRKLTEVKQAFLSQHPQEPWDNPEKLFVWDLSFYRRLLLQADKLETEAMKEYFPLEPTLKSIHAKLTVLFDMEFHQVVSIEEKEALVGPGDEHALLWVDDAMMFTVWDTESIGGGFLGYLYYDLHPREYKFDHKVPLSFQVVRIKEQKWRGC
jgi:metallopeptidase MepB